MGYRVIGACFRRVALQPEKSRIDRWERIYPGGNILGRITMSENQICSVCGTLIQKDKTENMLFNIDNNEKALCKACEEKQLLAEMEKTFDEPLHRETKWN